MRRRSFLRGLTAATPLLAGCVGSDEPTVVAVGPEAELLFRPGTGEPLTVDAGTTVQFVWESNSHNIHVDSQPDGADWAGHEPLEDEGFEHEHTFDVAGEYRYWCVPHRPAGMVGDIVVESDEGGGIGGFY